MRYKGHFLENSLISVQIRDTLVSLSQILEHGAIVNKDDFSC